MDHADGPDLERLSEERLASRARDSALVAEVRAGDAHAFGRLYDAWFDRIFDLTSRIVRNPDIAAEVTQDAFLSAWRNLDSLENPDAFGGWLLRIARNAALNRSEREQRSRAVDDQELTVIESVGAGASNAPSGFAVEDRLGRAATPGAALEDREIVSLVWQAAEALPDRDAEVLDLQLRHGLTPAEIGEMLGLNRNAANQLVHRVRGRLEVAIRARVLWRAGEPVCDVLNQRLNQAAVTHFGAEAVKVIERHVPGCVECDERQRLRLQPAALFAAVPLLVAPILVKQSAAAALAAAGVPMAGSVALAGAAIAGGAVGSAGVVGQVASGHVGSQVGHQLGDVWHLAPEAAPGGQLGAQVGNELGHLGPQVGGHAGGQAAGAGHLAGAGIPETGVAHLGSQVGAGFEPGSGVASQVPSAAEAGGGYGGGGYGGGGDGADGGGFGGGFGGGADDLGGTAGEPQALVMEPPRNPWILASSIAAVLLFLLLLFGAGLWWGNRGDSSLVATGTTDPPPTAAGSLPQTTTFTVPAGTEPGTTTPGTELDTTTSSSTSTTAPASTTTPTPTTTIPAPTTTIAPTTAPTSTSTSSTSTSTSSTTTTTLPPLRLTLTISPDTKAFGGDSPFWYMNETDAPTARWVVVGSLAGRTVQVVGPEGGQQDVVLSTAMTGSHLLCPGTVTTTGAAGPICTKIALTTYTYTLHVLDAGGAVLQTDTATLTVT